MRARGVSPGVQAKPLVQPRRGQLWRFPALGLALLLGSCAGNLAQEPAEAQGPGTVETLPQGIEAADLSAESAQAAPRSGLASGTRVMVYDPQELWTIKAVQPPRSAGEEAQRALGDLKEGIAPASKAEGWEVTGSGRFIKSLAPAAVAPEAGEITLNFENTDIREVVKVVLGDLLDINYILDPGVKGNATLQTGRPLRLDDLLPTLETLLRMNGAALVMVDGIYRVVPAAQAVRGTLTPQLGDRRKALPSGYNLQVVPLRYISVVEMAKILEPLAQESSMVRVDTARNLLVLAGTAQEIQLLLETIEVFDVHWIRGLSVGFFPLDNVEAGDILKDLEAVFGADAEGPLAGVLRVVPISSANGLLAVTQNPEYLKEVGKWIRRLDEAGATGSAAKRLFVYRVRNGDAAEMAGLLTELFATDVTASRGVASSASVAPGKTPVTMRTSDKKAQETPAARTTARPAVATIAEESGRLSDEIKVVADEANNSLLILATPSDYEKVRNALERLDIVPLQVLIEATIIEVDLVDDFQFGLQWYFDQYYGGGYTGTSALTNASGGIPGEGPQFSAQGFAWTLLSGSNTVKAVLTALAEDSLANVLSSPSVMVLDNQSARIQVGDQVAIPTQALTDTTSTNITNSIEYRDTGIVLSVTPRINPGGLVLMEIEQEVSNVKEGSDPDRPTISTRNISSSIAVDSGKTVVLGGLIRDEKSQGKEGIPGLYKIPVLGWAFGSQNERTRRTELVVMLTPRVIASGADAQDVVDDFRIRLKGLEGAF